MKGQFQPDDPGRWRGWLARYNGKRVAVTLTPERRLRSMSANAYLWGVVYAAIAEWSGHDALEIHAACKGMFLPARHLTTPAGEELTIPASTRLLASDEFSEYVSKVKRWAAECGVYVPEANEVRA